MKKLKYISTIVIAGVLATVLGCAATPQKEGINEPTLKSSEINVETFKGTVQLSGFVSTDAKIQKAVEVTRGVTGVKYVRNDMRVK
jgi:hypothetical protein